MMHKYRTIIGVMGGAQVPQEVVDQAFHLGERIADEKWVLLCGGRDAGVMRAAAEGAKSRNGLTIGILPGSEKQQANPFIDIAIVTNLGDARNYINILSSDVVVACKGGAGTISEIALALKNDKPVIQLQNHFSRVFPQAASAKKILTADTPEHCIELIKHFLY